MGFPQFADDHRPGDSRPSYEAYEQSRDRDNRALIESAENIRYIFWTCLLLVGVVICMVTSALGLQIWNVAALFMSATLGFGFGQVWLHRKLKVGYHSHSCSEHRDLKGRGR